mmetsp:Transcript_27705/g.56044  ORF Transcript_27705/g.56044 Transcript_27705/m.56044 type:complete len:550 (+) Transcript_27705:231-1880(+)
MQVIPGPCGLYRYDALGDLKRGPMRQYFRMFQRSNQSLLMKNVEIVEDRIPGTLLSFPIKGDKEEVSMPAEGWPQTGFVREAIFYVEATKPLSQLCKQRRRWLNGTFATYIWILREGLIQRSRQDETVKFLSSIILLISIIQGFLVRLFGPGLLIVWVTRFGLLLPALINNPAKVFSPDINLTEVQGESALWGLLFGGSYTLLYVAYIIGHMPRAKAAEADLDIVRFSEPSGNYRSDKKSAYRGWLMWPAVWVNAFVFVLYCINIIGILVNLGWSGTPNPIRFMIIMCAFPFAVGLVDAVSHCNIRTFWGMVYSIPASLPLMIWYTTWLPAYASTRASDLTWGNRSTNDFDETGEALNRERYGRLFASLLIVTNVCVAWAVLILSDAYGNFFTVVVITYTGILSLPQVIAVMDMVYRLIRGVGMTMMHGCNRFVDAVEGAGDGKTPNGSSENGVDFVQMSNYQDRALDNQFTASPTAEPTHHIVNGTVVPYTHETAKIDPGYTESCVQEYTLTEYQDDEPEHQADDVNETFSMSGSEEGRFEGSSGQLL